MTDWELIWPESIDPETGEDDSDAPDGEDDYGADSFP